MAEFLLTATAALLFACLVLILLFLYQKGRAKTYAELYDATRERNKELSAQIGRMEAAEIIKDEERGKADEKINSAYSGGARSRFDAINNGLRGRTEG